MQRTIVIGSGIGGLAAALRLAHDGHDVTVLERHTAPGGKMRTLPSPAGHVDAGPTVLTMFPVFQDLFHSVRERLEDHVTLIPQSILARHFWPDGSQLDLHADPMESARAVADFAGTEAAAQFRAFSDKARTMFRAFDKPMMQTGNPSLVQLIKEVIKNPALLLHMSPGQTLAGMLTRDFDDPRLQQLFGRYATYVGGSPYQSPALLGLIWHAEAQGVSVVKGGMHALAQAVEALARQKGASFIYECGVQRIEKENGRVTGVVTEQGNRLTCDTVVFNGDPLALATGMLGPDVETVAPQTRNSNRSLSADVWSFGATPKGPCAKDLIHHNVFFCQDPKTEFTALAAGKTPTQATLYVCAQDRGHASPPTGAERFEIIRNAPPLPARHQETTQQCQDMTFLPLRSMGLEFDKMPEQRTLTRPTDFETMFPGSRGSLYGQSPHGMMASLKRPRARTNIAGLYLVGGGTHPGAGVPMATLSARHVVEAMKADQTSTSPSRRTAMPGGMSTESALTGGGPSRSSPS